MTTTIKKQLAECLRETGDKPDDLTCFYQNHHGQFYSFASDGQNDLPVIRATFDELPEREFDAGFGGTEGEPTIAFSERYVYIRVYYDGAEGFDAVPRNPENVGASIPWFGGG